MKSINELTAIIGEAMTGINLHTGNAQERLGVGDCEGAMAEVLKVSAHATAAGLANQTILDQYGVVPTPAPVPPAPPTEGGPVVVDVGQSTGGDRQPWHTIAYADMNDADWLYAANVQGAQSKIWGPQGLINVRINAYSRVGGWKYAELFPDPDKQYRPELYAGPLK